MLLLLVFFCCISSFSCVEELTASDFEDAIKKHKNVLVEFYTPWCTTCSAFEPMYDNVMLEFAGEKDILIARIDADEAKALAKKYEVEHFPTIWLFTNGSTEGMEYLGDLDEESVVDFVIDEVDGSNEAGSGHKDDFLHDDDEEDDDDKDDDDDDDDDEDADWKKMQDDIDHMNDVLSGAAGKKNDTTFAAPVAPYRRAPENTTAEHTKAIV